ncbi:hypothetical protein CRM22_000661 [Opisthorchis felineus]|uniref:Uncharacterized protein n=1 Tax=Opisthorchis felineus TaxID=147828 RepID=A0A4S2ME08_OPIFE|nr:hypothetical protein CRM22_000661 [Opisthorchis felineus]
MVPFLFLFLVVSASSSKVDDCTNSCTASPKQDACARGCYYAYALTLAPEAPNDRPTCKKSCEENFTGEDEKACETGCEQFETSDGWFGALGLMDTLRDFMSQMLSSKPDDTANANTELNSGPVVVSRIRIFIPIEQADVAPEDAPSHALVQPNEETGSQSDQVPHHMMFAHQAPVDSKSVYSGEDMECWFRRMLHAPYLLLFVVTLSTLLVLLFVQLALCVRRRYSAPRGYRYAPLPTYAEATNIKVPIVGDADELKQPLKQEDA